MGLPTIPPGHLVEDVRLSGIHLLYRGGYSMQQPAGGPAVVLRNVERFRSYHSRAIADMKLERAERREF